MRTLYLGMDATVRTWLNRGEGYLPAVEIGEVVRGSGIGRIVASRSPVFAVGRRRLLAARLAGLRRRARRRLHHPDRRPRRSPVDDERVRRHRGGRLLRPHRHRPAGAGSDGRRVGRRRSHRLAGRSDRQDHGLPGRGHRRFGRQVRVGGRRARLRRMHQPPHRRPGPGAERAVPRPGRRLLRQRGWRHPRRGAGPPGHARARGAVRRHLRLQRPGAPARPRRTTST